MQISYAQLSIKASMESFVKPLMPHLFFELGYTVVHPARGCEKIVQGELLVIRFILGGDLAAPPELLQHF